MIRKMAETEAERVMEIWLEATVEAHPFLPKAYWLSKYTEVEEKYLPFADTYIYEIDGHIEGFISVMGEGFIGALFVDVNRQSKGIGTALLDHVKEVYPSLSLSVYAENTPAIDFYKANGFAIEAQMEEDDTQKLEYMMKYKRK